MTSKELIRQFCLVQDDLSICLKYFPLVLDEFLVYAHIQYIACLFFLQLFPLKLFLLGILEQEQGILLLSSS